MLDKFIKECVDRTCMADILGEGDVEQCKACAAELKELNVSAERHQIAVKAAIKQHAKTLG